MLLPMAVHTASPSAAFTANQEVATQGMNVGSLEQLFSLARLAAPRRCRHHDPSPGTEQCSDIGRDDDYVDDGAAHASGVCKYYVNSGRCPRGALCTHAHDASLRHRWLRDR